MINIMKKLIRFIINHIYTYPRSYFIKQKNLIKFKRALNNKPLRIVIGSSGIYQKNWAASEIDFLDLLKERDWQKFFTENSIEAILAEHVWEHLSKKESYLAAKRCYQYLKGGGYLRVAVPDGLHPSQEYINAVKPRGKDSKIHKHKTLYTYQTFREIFEFAGFKVRLLEYFSENGKFHFRKWNPKEGMVTRSSRFDERNTPSNLAYTSIILDAYKLLSPTKKYSTKLVLN